MSIQHQGLVVSGNVSCDSKECQLGTLTLKVTSNFVGKSTKFILKCYHLNWFSVVLYYWFGISKAVCELLQARNCFWKVTVYRVKISHFLILSWMQKLAKSHIKVTFGITDALKKGLSCICQKNGTREYQVY